MIFQGHKWKLESVYWNPTANTKRPKRYPPSKGISGKGKDDVPRNGSSMGYG
jgi:hypothetical protein